MRKWFVFFGFVFYVFPVHSSDSDLIVAIDGHVINLGLRPLNIELPESLYAQPFDSLNLLRDFLICCESKGYEFIVTFSDDHTEELQEWCYNTHSNIMEFLEGHILSENEFG